MSFGWTLLTRYAGCHKLLEFRPQPPAACAPPTLKLPATRRANHGIADRTGIGVSPLPVLLTYYERIPGAIQSRDHMRLAWLTTSTSSFGDLEAERMHPESACSICPTWICARKGKCTMQLPRHRASTFVDTRRAHDLVRLKRRLFLEQPIVCDMIVRLVYIVPSEGSYPSKEGTLVAIFRSFSLQQRYMVA